MSPLCFYCGRASGGHEADHAPVPERHGGEQLVPACRHCHNLKDRMLLVDWSPEEWQAIAHGTSLEAVVLLGVLGRVLDGQDIVPVQAAYVRDVAEACTTSCARIAVFKTFGLALDATDGQVLA